MEQKPDDRSLVACACDQCKRLCTRFPGWMYPAEAMLAMDAGHARELMLDYRIKEGERRYDVPVLCPAVIDRKGRNRGGWLCPDMWERLPVEDQIDPRKGVGSMIFSTLAIMMAQMKGDIINGTCVLLTADGACRIHDTGFKPVECRTGFGCDEKQGAHYVERVDIAKTWDTQEGNYAVERWRHITGCFGVPFLHVNKGDC